MSFDAKLNMEDGNAVIRLTGELDSGSAGELNTVITEAAGHQPGRLVLLMKELTYMSSAGLRCLVFAQQKMPDEAEIVLVAPTPDVTKTITMTGFDSSVTMEHDTPAPS